MFVDAHAGDAGAGARGQPIAKMPSLLSISCAVPALVPLIGTTSPASLSTAGGVGASSRSPTAVQSFVS